MNTGTHGATENLNRRRGGRPAAPPRATHLAPTATAPALACWERARAAAAAEPGLALEIGMIRLALARLLEEETNAVRFAQGVARLVEAAVQAARMQKGLAEADGQAAFEAVLRSVLAEDMGEAANATDDAPDALPARAGAEAEDWRGARSLRPAPHRQALDEGARDRGGDHHRRDDRDRRPGEQNVPRPTGPRPSAPLARSSRASGRPAG